MVLLLAVAAKDDALAVGGAEGAAVIASRRVRERADVFAVGVHDIELEVVGAAAVGAEDDVLAVGRVAALGVVAGGVREAFEAGAVHVGFENVHGGIEIPKIAAALVGAPLLVAAPIFLGVA